MKSETVETDRIKIESRQSIHRRKMSKNSSIVNGADESLSYAAAEDEYEVKLAAALQDHLPYTKKSGELCKHEPRSTLPSETDHIYANSNSETKNKSQNNIPPFNPATTSKLTVENEKMRKLLIVQFELIKRLERDRNSEKSEKLEPESVKDRKKGLMAVLRNRRKSDNASEDANISQAHSVDPDGNTNLSASTVTSTTAEPSAFAVPAASSTIPPVNLVTRYFGRRSKTIPSRALKRRYLGPPKTIPLKKPTPVSLSSATSVSSESEIHEDEMVTPKPEPMDPKESRSICTKTSLIDIKRISKKQGKGTKGFSRISDFLTTDKTYYWPHIETSQSPLVCNETVIDVPTWKVNKVSTFYHMEGTENINDSVFERRHLKYELDERRRKRWDIQRLREQKASEKLKYKNGKNVGKEAENNVKQKAQSFYPRIQNIEYIEITDQIPVLAFGYPIPLFQPSEFSLSWKCAGSSPIKCTVTPPNKISKRSRLSSPTGTKIT